MTQVPILPPPWGPRRDPHFDATHTFEGIGYHSQVDVQTAAEFGWYFRSEWYKRLIPDTRRCRNCGAIMFEELELTPEQEATFYTAQIAGYATGPIG